MRKYNTGFFLGILRLSIGLFFIILGIKGIFWQYSESVFSLHRAYTTLEVIFGVIELACGIMIFAGFFITRRVQAIYWGSIVALILWITRIVLTKFAWGLSFIVRGNINISLFFEWLLILACEIIIGLVLLILIRNYD